jgi:hypothetical protein
MEEHGIGSLITRRNEDIALDMMKFIAVTTGYGKTGSPEAGFKGGTVSQAEDHAQHLLDLFGQCLAAVQGKKQGGTQDHEPEQAAPVFFVA